ncbi:unnamed protein product [Effrenium voratum]|nr:unnamed protein product [Effrenium voratum]
MFRLRNDGSPQAQAWQEPCPEPHGASRLREVQEVYDVALHDSPKRVRPQSAPIRGRSAPCMPRSRAMSIVNIPWAAVNAERHKIATSCWTRIADFFAPFVHPKI